MLNGGSFMEGKWLIADRDLNEREGLKWLLKTSSIPVTSIFMASDFQEFRNVFEREVPHIVLIELDMIGKEDWSNFRDLIQIYEPILLLTSAEATFEKARLAVDLQALDLMIKPFSAKRVKSALQKASRKLTVPHSQNKSIYSNSYKEMSFESLFLPGAATEENYFVAACKTESLDALRTLYSFLSEYPFKDVRGIFGLNDMVILLFMEHCTNVTEQCQKALRRWEEEYSEPLAIVVQIDKSSKMTLYEKYKETRKMLEITYYKGYRQVVAFNESPKWVQRDPFLAPPEQQAWIEMLHNFSLEEIKDWLYDEFLQLTMPYPDPGLVRIRLTSILAQVRRFMKTYQLDENLAYEKEYHHIFNSILYDTVLYRTVQNFILFLQNIFEGAKSNIQNVTQDPIERGITYIETNYSKSNLKLKDVAEYVERNPSYFSHLLMTKTGLSFKGVLTKIRMKEAKKLLIETSKPIKEISKLVGYQNSNYFSRMFKETTGVSPKEFRLQKMKT